MALVENIKLIAGDTVPVNLCLNAKYVAWCAPLGSAFANVVYSQNKIILRV